MFGDQSGPSDESIALQQALETHPQGDSISQLPPELVQLAQQMGLDPNDPETFMILMSMLGGNGMPGAVPAE